MQYIDIYACVYHKNHEAVGIRPIEGEEVSKIIRPPSWTNEEVFNKRD